MSDFMVKERLRQLAKSLTQVMISEINLSLELNPEEDAEKELKEALKSYFSLLKALEKQQLGDEDLKSLINRFREGLLVLWSAENQ